MRRLTDWDGVGRTKIRLAVGSGRWKASRRAPVKEPGERMGLTPEATSGAARVLVLTKGLPPNEGPATKPKLPAEVGSFRRTLLSSLRRGLIRHARLVNA